MRRILARWRQLRQKRVTLLAVPSDGGRTKTIGFSYATVTVAAGFLAMALIGGAFLSYYAYTQTDRLLALRQELGRQRELNSTLKMTAKEQEEKITFLSDRVAIVETTLAKINDVSHEIHGLLDKLGIGNIKNFPTFELTAEPSGQGGPLLATVATTLNVLEESVPEQKQNLDSVRKVLSDEVKRIDHTPSIWPTEGWVSSPFGRRKDPFNGNWAYHEGIDIAGQKGTKVVAAAAGKVTYAGYKSGYGNVVIISHGYGIETRYGHNSEVKVKKGAVVEKGQLVALMGNTGRSTGAHLHYEVLLNGKPVSPFRYLPDR